MTSERHSAFLEKRAYRQRRLTDIARILPVFGAIIFFLPLLWILPGARAASSTTWVMSYLFVSWLGLIVIAGVISSRLPGSSDAPGPSRDE